ncbi:MAG: aminopeptidase P family protein [Candidatus Rokubacteria bacterium]|nr:aminopeptidase P family protein [Candidatus Rokubacteria bacterium]MBI3825208.1 aminopeptidase P family protein [Candidatus Rokubacteria bacterium]
MYPHQSERLTEALDAAGVDALVATAAANVRYVTGFESVVPGRAGGEILAVFARGAATALVVPAAEAPGIVIDGPSADVVRCHGELPLAKGDGEDAHRVAALVDATAPAPAGALAAALAQLGVSGRIGLDESGLTARAWRALVAGLEGREPIEASTALRRARAVKGPWEIEAAQRALRAAEESLNAVIQMLAPGVSEREAVTLWRREVDARGARPVAAVIATGARAALPAAAPSDRALRAGEVVRFDVCCSWQGYHATLGRTAVMGAPTSRIEAAHAAAQAGLEAAIDSIRPGVAAGGLVAAALERAPAAGSDGVRLAASGHGVGLSPSEAPTLARGGDERLEAGMVLALETAWYDIGLAGVQVKDTVLVTRVGATVLNGSVRGLVILD